MPLTNGSGCGSGSCYFRHWPSRHQQKTNLKKSFFAYFFLEVHLRHFSKIKKSKRSHKTLGIKFFLLFLLDDRRIRSQIWIRIREAQRHVDPVDPDPEHWLTAKGGKGLRPWGRPLCRPRALWWWCLVRWRLRRAPPPAPASRTPPLGSARSPTAASPAPPHTQEISRYCPFSIGPSVK